MAACPYRLSESPARSAKRLGSCDLLASASLRLDMAGSDYVAPLFNLVPDARVELLGRACHQIKTKRCQAFLHVGHANDLDDLAMEQIDDNLRRPSRNENTDPIITLDFRIAGFSHGRHVRLYLRACFAGDGERTQCTCLDILPGRRNGGEADGAVSRDD